MISRADFMGRSQHLTPGSDFDVHPFREIGTSIAVDASAPGLTGTLPAATRWPHTGGIIATFFNIGSNAFAIEDADGGAVATVGVAEGGVLALLDNSSAAGQWMFILYDMLS